MADGTAAGPNTGRPELAELQHRNALALAGGGADRVAKQHAKGKLTARERIELFLDPGSLEELDRLVEHDCRDFGMEHKRTPGDGVVSGFGKVDGRTVFVFAQDFTVFGGSMSAANAGKICKIMDMAMRVGAPVIGLNDSGGARIQEGVRSLGGYADIFLRNTLASGVVPQLSADPGPLRRRRRLLPRDHRLRRHGREDTSYMYVTGPSVVKTVTQRGGHLGRRPGRRRGSHAGTSGRGPLRERAGRPRPASALAAQELLWATCRANNAEDPPAPPRRSEPAASAGEELRLDTLIPDERDEAVRHQECRSSSWSTSSPVDSGLASLEVHAAPRQEHGLSASRGSTGARWGSSATSPTILSGVLDIKASLKAARFVRFCDCFNLPIVTFVDVPGFLPGVAQEHGGIIKHGAKLLYAFCEATVPKLTVITRKAYGGAYDVMSSKHVRGDFNLAWPTAEIAVMGPKGAVEIIFRREINEAEDRTAREDELIADYKSKFANPYTAAERGYIDEVIEARHTRRKLCTGLDMLQGKRAKNPPKKHGNLPL